MTKKIVLLINLCVAIAVTTSNSYSATLIATPGSYDQILGEGQSAVTLGYTTDVNSGLTGITGSNSLNDRRHANLIVGFNLPTLAAGETISSVSLTYRIAVAREQFPSMPELDTYLLDTADPSGSGTSLFLEADTDTNPNNILVGTVSEADTGDISVNNQVFTEPNFSVTFNLSGSSLSLLQSFYSGTTPSQSEAFFRWNLDSDTTISQLNRWVLDVDGADAPSLTITTIPEPSTYMLLMLSTGVLWMLRKRRVS